VVANRPWGPSLSDLEDTVEVLLESRIPGDHVRAGHPGEVVRTLPDFVRELIREKPSSLPFRDPVLVPHYQRDHDERSDSQDRNRERAQAQQDVPLIEYQSGLLDS
jgi:hypothetical protein